MIVVMKAGSPEVEIDLSHGTGRAEYVPFMALAAIAAGGNGCIND